MYFITYMYIYICKHMIYTCTYSYVYIYIYMDIDIDCRSLFYHSFRNQRNFKGVQSHFQFANYWDLNPKVDRLNFTSNVSIRVTWWVLPYSWCPTQHPETTG